MKILFVFIFATLLAFSSDSKYRLEQGVPAPAEAPASLREAITSPGVKVLTAAGETYMEFWFNAKPMSAAAKEETGATLDRVQHGAFAGVVRVGKNVNDRRGDRIPAGLYVLRLSFHPVDGAHQGVATQRDFLILTKVASDTSAAATPAFTELMQLAKEASGTNHPLSLSCWKQDQEFSPGLHAAGENDTVLQVNVGGVQLAIIIAGRHEG
jgi:hypothetical protein